MIKTLNRLYNKINGTITEENRRIMEETEKKFRMLDVIDVLNDTKQEQCDYLMKHYTDAEQEEIIENIAIKANDYIDDYGAEWRIAIEEAVDYYLERKE